MEKVLINAHGFTVYNNGGDLTFENDSTGESFTLYCELTFGVSCFYAYEWLMEVKVLDYDGCFDFDRDMVEKVLKKVNENMKFDYSEI